MEETKQYQKLKKRITEAVRLRQKVEITSSEINSLPEWELNWLNQYIASFPYLVFEKSSNGYKVYYG